MTSDNKKREPDRQPPRRPGERAGDPTRVRRPAAPRRAGAAVPAGKKPDKMSRPYRHARKVWRKRVSGRPTRSTAVVSVPEAIWSGVKKALKLALIIVLVVGFLFAGLGLGMLSGYISTTQPLEIVDVRKTYEATNIYDRNGELAAVLTGSQNVLREYVPIARMKKTYIEEAFIAIEDERFETHNGIDPKRITNAVASIFLHAGEASHGASTITQQVVKMMSGADERSAQRKVQEWERALELERRMSKDEIMELFLNMVPMANRYVGVQAAAKGYFGKDISELDLAECAFLAGIPNLPSIYNPRTEYGRRNALRRMRITLSKMYELGKIEEDEYLHALNRELIFVDPNDNPIEGKVNSYFVDAVVYQVIDDLVEQRGYSYELANTAVFQHGLRIETTLDPEVQKKAEASFMKKELFSENYEALPDIPEPPQAAVTIISNAPDSRGEVVGLVGGYGEKKSNFVFNRATQAYRQPGSSIKPILVYAPAMEMGLLTAGSVFIDEPKYLDPQHPDRMWPSNVNNYFSGKVTMRQALKESMNTIAVEVYVKLTSPAIALSYLRRLGIDRTDEQQPAGALGAFAHGMTTFEMAGAFSALANNGIYTKPILYHRVLDAEGHVLLENKPDYDQVFSVETASIMTNVLEDTLMNTGWIAPYARLSEQTGAGKTGTTSDQIDVWFCGYTPYYTAAVWYGFDNANGRRTEITYEDTHCAKRIWRDVMEQIHEGKEPKPFEMAGNIRRLTVCSESGELATQYCKHTYTEYYDATKPSMPSMPCPLHRAPPKTKPAKKPTTTTKPKTNP